MSIEPALPVDKANDPVLQFCHRLSIELFRETDPDLLADIFRNDMRLAGLECLEQALGHRLTQSNSLLPLIGAIQSNIRTFQPAVAEFLSTALGQDLIPQVSPERMRRFIHYTYLLDAVCRLMVERLDIMIGIYHHLLEQRERIGIQPGFLGSFLEIYRLTGSLFLPVKIKTMDWVLRDAIHLRERVGPILKKEKQDRIVKLVINIVEAIWTDRIAGFKSNAITGLVLAIDKPTNCERAGKHGSLEWDTSRSWSSLYTTWNLCFITGHLSNLQLLYPKLLVPSILCVEPQHYIFARMTGLWTTLTFDLFARKAGLKLSLPNHGELAKVWGRINERYAQAHIQKVRGTRVRGLRDMWRIFFSRREP